MGGNGATQPSRGGRADDTARTRRLTIIAQDPSVRFKGVPLLADVEVPTERLATGPRGYRVHVIDFDATENAIYLPNGRRALGTAHGDPQ